MQEKEAEEPESESLHDVLGLKEKPAKEATEMQFTWFSPGFHLVLA